MILSADRRAQLTRKAEALEANLEQASVYLASRGLSMEAARLFNLGVADRGEHAGRLAIPYYTENGVVAIKYRAMDGASPKYLNESGCGVHLYNARVLIREADRVVLTEGELDAVTVQAYTGIPAVAYPGVDTWKKEGRVWRLCFQDVAEVIVIADGDNVGRDTAAKVAESIGNHARVVHMPDDCKDANQFIAERKVGAFLERINL